MICDITRRPATRDSTSPLFSSSTILWFYPANSSIHAVLCWANLDVLFFVSVFDQNSREVGYFPKKHQSEEDLIFNRSLLWVTFGKFPIEHGRSDVYDANIPFFSSCVNTLFCRLLKRNCLRSTIFVVQTSVFLKILSTDNAGFQQV